MISKEALDRYYFSFTESDYCPYCEYEYEEDSLEVRGNHYLHYFNNRCRNCNKKWKDVCDSSWALIRIEEIE